MIVDLSELANIVSSDSRKGFFRKRPIFARYASPTPSELDQLQIDLGLKLPSAFCDWVLTVGYGDINEELSFRREWVARIASGQLQGGTIFAHDIEGNFYAFDDPGHIYFLSRSEPAYVQISAGFPEFVEELVRRDYRLLDWVHGLPTRRYDW